MYDSTNLVRYEPADKDTIFACADPRQLYAWHREAYDKYDDVEVQIETRRLVGTADADWLRRIGGFAALCSMVMRWTERRLAELGQPLPVTRDTGHAKAIAQLERSLRKAHKMIHDLGGDPATLREQK